MELLQQFFMTAFAALIFSILIAKIVSVAIIGDDDVKHHDSSKIPVEEELKFKAAKISGGKSKGKSKSKKKVRFAIDDDEVVVVNKFVKFDAAEPSEKHQIGVVEKSFDLVEVYVGASRTEEELMIARDVGSPVKSPEKEFDSVQNQIEGENVDSQLLGELPLENSASSLVDSPVKQEDHGNGMGHHDGDSKEGAESAIDRIIDGDQTGEGKSELIDQKLSEGTINNDIREENALKTDEDQKCLKLSCDDKIDKEVKEEKGLISDEKDSDDDYDDDWEGVERSDLEKVFAMASNYGKVDDHLQSLGSDTQMQLYGLHKVAMEGPCHEAQPMALKVSARAKWNAWQMLGNMSPDVAMEQYIGLLSEKVPQWSHVMLPSGVESSDPNTTSIQDTSQKDRKRELESGSDGADLIEFSDSVNEAKE